MRLEGDGVQAVSVCDSPVDMSFMKLARETQIEPNFYDICGLVVHLGENLRSHRRYVAYVK